MRRLALAAFLAVAAAAQAEEPWYKRCLVGMEVGPTGAQIGIDPSDTGYAAKFSGTEIVQKQIEANSEYLVIWGKDSEYAYYDSKVAPKCPGMGDRDVIREAVEAAKPHGLPVVVYCVVQGNGYPLRDHPEYQMRGPDGAALGRICLNSGYLRHAKDVVAEMLAYDIAGFHIDMLDQGFGPPYGCWCDACKEKFQAEYGRPMPPGVTWDEDWDRMMEFRYNTSARFEVALRDYIRSIDPGVSIDYNYHGYPPFSWEVGQRPVQHAHVGDFVTCESGVWGFSALGAGLTAMFTRATDPTQPYQVVIQRGARIYHDQTTRPLNDMRWELFTLLAHGAQVTIVDKTGYDGSLDRLTYERARDAFAEARAKREHFGQKPLPEVGLYYSCRTRDWYGRETPYKYLNAYFGAHEALTLEHIPVGVLLDENLSLEGLRQFPVVLLPNAAILSPKEEELFRAYVEEGGKLIVTGVTGLYDRLGAPRADSSLGELIGARLSRIMDANDNHFRLAAAPDYPALERDVPLDCPFVVYGPAAVYEPTTAKPLGELMAPHRTVRQLKGQEGTEQPNSADAPVGPALLINTLGKGQVLCIALSPDFATASEYGMPEARKLLRNAVRFLNPEPEVEITAPMNVQTVVTDDPARRILRVHLLGYVSPPGTTGPRRPYILPSLVEEPPLYRARVTLRRPVTSARALNPSTEVKALPNGAEATVNDIHEVLLLEY